MSSHTKDFKNGTCLTLSNVRYVSRVKWSNSDSPTPSCSSYWKRSLLVTFLQVIIIWPCQQMLYAQPSTCPRKWLTQTPMELWHTNGSPNLGQKTRPYNNQQQKKKIYKIVDFAVPADHRIKLKECEKRDKYLDHARDLKKLWNMEVTIIPIVIGAFGTVTKGLLKGL